MNSNFFVEWRDQLEGLEGLLTRVFNDVAPQKMSPSSNRGVREARNFVQAFKKRAIEINCKPEQWGGLYRLVTHVQRWAERVSEIRLSNAEEEFREIETLSEEVFQGCRAIQRQFKESREAMERLRKEIGDSAKRHAANKETECGNRTGKMQEIARTCKLFAAILRPILIGFILDVPAWWYCREARRAMEVEECWRDMSDCLDDLRKRTAQASCYFEDIETTVCRMTNELRDYKIDFKEEWDAERNLKELRRTASRVVVIVENAKVHMRDIFYELDRRGMSTDDTVSLD